MENDNTSANGNVYTVTKSNNTYSGNPILNNVSPETLVQINARSGIFKKRNCYKKTSVCLFILVLLLLIAFVIAICDYIKARHEVNILKREQICTSEECLRSAANLRLSMDTSVDPCEDFYKYSCGRWSKEHPNHGWYPHFSSFETVDERITAAVLSFLESNVSAKEPLPVRQSRDLYLSCMNVEAVDKLGYSVILKYLKEVDLPAIPSFFDTSKKGNFSFDWVKTEVALKRIFAMDTFLGFMVDADIYNRSNSVIYMGTPGSSCPLPSPLKKGKSLIWNIKSLRKPNKSDDDDKEEVEQSNVKEKAYMNIVKEVLNSIAINTTGSSLDKDLLEIAASSIWNITEDIEELAYDNSTYVDLQFYRLKVEQLQNLTDHILLQNNLTKTSIWRRYLTLMFTDVPNITLDLDNIDLIYIPEEELVYLPEIVLYLSKVPDDVLELYMWWVTVYAMIISTTSDIADFIARESTVYTRVNVYRSRSIDCASLVINFMGLAVSYGVADRTFLDNTKPKVEQMLSDIKDAFVERVEDLTWMDMETKRATLQKSREMISFIGFPEWLLNKKSLEDYYSNITMRNDTFLENMMSMVKQSIPGSLVALRQECERTWRTDPTTVNAYNYFSDNSITVPMAILTHPFYNLGLEVLNYGAIGSILGHELTHGFDNIGRKFDKYGNYKQWWSNKTIETFELKAKCFVSQYGNYSIPPIEPHIDGEKTLGENLADNGGLHHAYLAYKNYLRKHKFEPKLPGFERYSNLQLFFIAYGSIWCETPDIISLQYQIENDEHSPSAVRVLGTIQNSHEFAEVFNCPAGSKMNPNRARCRIW